jgi:DNA-binding MarR family transcriptional regulator
MERQQTPTETYAFSSKSARLAALIGRLERFASMYTKKALADSPIDNTDDIIYLMVLAAMGTPRKSELIAENLSEFSTGVEVIRRLVNAGYVEEFPDPDDRRSKRVKITPQGKAIVQQTYPNLERAAQIATSSLREDDMDLLLQMLSRLDLHHTEVYQDVRQKTLAEVEAVFENKRPAADDE